MKLAAPVLALLIWPSSALAMNWEGHDDWMTDMTPDLALENFIPGAKPLASPDCPVTPEIAAQNPYEQIPLPHHNCRAEGERHSPAPLTPQ